MKRVYLILGDGKMGKSTLIRHLTGIREASLVDIALSGNQTIALWAWMRSAQEMPKSPAEIVSLIGNFNSAHCTDILLPLRILPANYQPGYLSYVNAIASAGHSIVQSIVLTNQAHVAPTFQQISPNIISNSLSQPSNVIAANVRALWNWQ